MNKKKKKFQRIFMYMLMYFNPVRNEKNTKKKCKQRKKRTIDEQNVVENTNPTK